MKLIPNWKRAWRFWSLQLATLGTILTTTLIAFPDAALAAWGLLPSELKSAIPPNLLPLIGVGIFALSIVARLIKQDKIHD